MTHLGLVVATHVGLERVEVANDEIGEEPGDHECVGMGMR
jgi:hypothetical protein